MGYSLGVDLGTTFVAAAITHGNGVEMFPLGDGAMVTPAAVYLRSDGLLVTGDAAARRAISNPDRVAVEIKRRLGNPTPVMLGGVPHAVTALLAALLGDVLDRVAEVQGAKPDVVTLTHPANWGPYRRELFEEVPQAAGLEHPLYTTEPEAAAAHYLSTRRMADGELIGVYDLGGGTFDATVLRRSGTGFEILGAPEGIERLGGVDFDEAILAHVSYLGGDALGDLDMGDPRTVVALARLRQDCVLAKEALSVDVETTIPVFLPSRQFEVTLTRAHFEDLIRAPVESTIGTLARVLGAARVHPSELSAVLLVGGSSRIPLVGRMVAEEFGRPTVVGAHPKHAVALGAALLAGPAGGARTEPADRTPVPAPAPPPAAPSPVARAADAPPVGVAAAPPAASSPVRRPPGPASPAERVPETVAPSALVQPSPPAHPGAPAPGDPHTAPFPPSADAGQPLPPPRTSTDTTGDRSAEVPGSGTPPPPGAPGGPTGSAAADPPTGRRRLPLVLAAVLAVLVVAAGVVVYLLAQRGGPTRGTPAQAVPPTGSGPPSASVAASPVVASSVPVPSLGTAVPVGPTPNFVAVSPSGRQLYVAGQKSGVVTVVDTAVDKEVATIPIPAGPPQFLAFSPDGRRVYVSVWNDARTIAAVTVLDTTTNSVVATTPVHTRPFLGAVTPDGKHLYVPNHDSGTVTVISTSTNTVETEFSVPPNPHWVAFNATGTRAYVADHESNLVSVVDTSSNSVVAKVPVQASPHSLAVNPKLPLLAVADYDAADVSLIDTGSNAVVATVPVGKNPQNVAWAPDGRFLYVVNNTDDTVSVVGAESHQVTAVIPTEGSPTSIAVLPDGRRGYVSDLNAGKLTVLDLAG